MRNIKIVFFISYFILVFDGIIPDEGISVSSEVSEVVAQLIFFLFGGKYDLLYIYTFPFYIYFVSRRYIESKNTGLILSPIVSIPRSLVNCQQSTDQDENKK